MPKPIETKQDIILLVDSFYDKVFKDELLMPHFADIIWEHHKPRMIQFWSFILLDEEGFTGNVFDKHVRLKINETHFTRWLKLFDDTVDELFTGEKANLAKQRAHLLGYTFQTKLEQMNDPKKII